MIDSVKGLLQVVVARSEIILLQSVGTTSPVGLVDYISLSFV